MGILDSLFGGGGSSESGTPDFLKRAGAAPFWMIGRDYFGDDWKTHVTSRNFSDAFMKLDPEDIKPYEFYPGDRIAPTPEQFTAAAEYTNQIASDPTGLSGNPLMQQAAGLIGRGTTFDQAGVDQYMNPYTTNVIDELYRIGSEKLYEDLLPQVNSTFTGAGQFGSSRHEDFTNRALRDTQREVLGQSANVLMQGQNQAFDQYAGAQERDIKGGLGMAQLPGIQAGADVNYLNNLLRTGAVLQTDDQARLDWEYEEWWKDQNRVQEFLGDWGGAQGNSSGFNTTRSSDGSPGYISALTGIATAGLGAGGLAGLF